MSWEDYEDGRYYCPYKDASCYCMDEINDETGRSYCDDCEQQKAFIKYYKREEFMRKYGNIIFYLLQFTWGILMNIIGVIVFLALICAGKKIEREGKLLTIKVGEYYGGFTMGIFCVCNRHPSLRMLLHESGHTIQNLMFGPIQIFISIASVVRYWYREIAMRVGKKLKDYDSVWFESMATTLGYRYNIIRSYNG